MFCICCGKIKLFHFCLRGSWHFWVCGGTFSRDFQVVVRNPKSLIRILYYFIKVSFHFLCNCLFSRVIAHLSFYANFLGEAYLLYLWIPHAYWKWFWKGSTWTGLFAMDAKTFHQICWSILQPYPSLKSLKGKHMTDNVWHMASSSLCSLLQNFFTKLF